MTQRASKDERSGTRAGFEGQPNVLGVVLADLRKAKGLSLREVQEATGDAVSNAYLSQLERQKIKKPSPNVLRSLAKVYGVPYETLMEKAGYLLPDSDEEGGRRRRLAVFAIDDLTAEEEEELLKYLAFLRFPQPILTIPTPPHTWSLDDLSPHYRPDCPPPVTSPLAPLADAAPSEAPSHRLVGTATPIREIVSRPSLAIVERQRLATAVVYCEANFGEIDGKTANGLVRHSERYDIVAVIDSHKAGLDAGVVLDDKANDVPICFDLEAALAQVDRVPDYFIFGIAPSSGMLSAHERGLVLKAIGLGMDIVSGMHEFLADDPEFAAASDAAGVLIRDVRKPRATKDLRVFSGRISEVDCPRIAVLGPTAPSASERPRPS